MITDINAKVIEGAGDTIDALLRMNRDKLNKAFLKEDPTQGTRGLPKRIE